MLKSLTNIWLPGITCISYIFTVKISNDSICLVCHKNKGNVLYSLFIFFTGPLLYHYSDIPNEVSIELSYEEVERVIKQIGFEIVVSR